MITAAIQTGMYISIVKLAVFATGFFLWLPLLRWANEDAGRVHTQVEKWTAIFFIVGIAGTLFWLLIPLYIIGLLMYLVAILSVSLIYVMHRNARVDEFQKILTADHIKSLFTNEDKEVEKITKGLVFITANKNKAPAPQPKTPEFFGFKTCQAFFDDAIWRRASDIALIPAATQYNVHYVIDGTPEKQEPKEREEIDYFLRYLKNLADLDINEKRKPQTGQFTVEKDGHPYKWSLTTAGTTAGEQIRLRLLAEYSMKKLDEIGLLEDQLDKISKLKDGRKGVFIVSGPKKSGVTTTLYALIRNHDPFMNNINLLEKQPAGEVPNITQNVYSLSDTGTSTYARRFQTMLRTGPDIVGVEHCNDKDIARLACNSAKDDRMTYVTMEANSVNDAMAKWLNFIGDRSLAVDTLVGICNQRLVRKLCEDCREPYEPNRDMLRKFNIPADKIKVFYRQAEPQYDKHGKPIICQNCQNTGFYDRQAVVEFIILDDETKKLLKTAKSTAEIANILRRAKMLYLQEQAIRKVANGTTSINEVIRALSNPQDARKRAANPAKK